MMAILKQKHNLAQSKLNFKFQLLIYNISTNHLHACLSLAYYLLIQVQINTIPNKIGLNQIKNNIDYN